MLKKVLALSLALMLLLSLAGCGIPDGNKPSVTAPSTKPTVPPNPYKVEDFSFNGKYMVCNTIQSHAGIDVSSHQGVIDWQQVKDHGIEFVFVRLGYRGYDYGNIRLDECAAYNLTQAKAAGLKVGAYFFSQAINEAEATEEAEFALSVLDGFELDLPLAFDWEKMEYADARTDKVKKSELMACIKAYCQTVEDAGYRAMIYFNPELVQTHLELIELVDYPFWLAAYSAQTGMDFPYRMEFWQYRDDGTVPGIDGPVDMDIWLPVTQPA